MPKSTGPSSVAEADAPCLHGSIKPGFYCPDCARFVRVADRSLAASMFEDIVRMAVPPLSRRDALFLAFRSASTALFFHDQRPGRWAGTPDEVRLFVAEAAAFVGSALPDIAQAEGFDPVGLRWAKFFPDPASRRRLRPAARHAARGAAAELGIPLRVAYRGLLRFFRASSERAWEEWSAAFNEWQRTTWRRAEAWREQFLKWQAGRGPCPQPDEVAEAVARCEGTLLRRAAGTRIVSLPQAAKELETALKAKGVWPARASDARTVRSELPGRIAEFISEGSVAPLRSYFRGDDGRVHVNVRDAADRMRTDLRHDAKECGRPRVEAPAGGSVEDGESTLGDILPAQAEDPVEAAEAVELVRLVHDLRQEFPGPAAEAALDHLANGTPLTDAAKAHGVSRKSARTALGKIKERAAVLLRGAQ